MQIIDDLTELVAALRAEIIILEAKVASLQAENMYLVQTLDALREN